MSKICAIKTFNIPLYYRSSVIGRIKEFRRKHDLRKNDFSPTHLDFGPISFYIARHFGFCYGVENAIEISYRAIDENPGKRIYLLSQMIHNQEVNGDLQSRGIQFILDTEGANLISWDKIRAEDIVILPAFGSTVETEQLLIEKGVEIQKYNTTCPFVEKVWNRAEKLGHEKYTTIIHGKPRHEETKATFSHSAINGPSLIIQNIEEAQRLGEFILGNESQESFLKKFEGKLTPGFNPEIDLEKVGVVNQTTMLATETQSIAEYLKEVMAKKYGLENLKMHYADTRDTLCYATNDNQDSTYQLLGTGADLAIVVGGYNSSNTSHIVELCEKVFPTYFINSEKEILSAKEIRHFDYHNQKVMITPEFLPTKEHIRLVITSGASCPDAVVDAAIHRILSFFPHSKIIGDVLSSLH